MARITPIDVIKGISGKYGNGRRVSGTSPSQGRVGDFLLFIRGNPLFV